MPNQGYQRQSQLPRPVRPQTAAGAPRRPPVALRATPIEGGGRRPQVRFHVDEPTAAHGCPRPKRPAGPLARLPKRPYILEEPTTDAETEWEDVDDDEMALVPLDPTTAQTHVVAHHAANGPQNYMALQNVDECNEGTFSNCTGARDVSCTRGEACGANMDCDNFPGGYNCTCSDGYVTDPQDNSSCISDACPNAPNIANAAMNESSNVFGDTVSYSCIEGYIPAIFNTQTMSIELTCNTAGVWVLNAIPQCVRRSCNFPGGRPHAYLQPTNLEFGSVATFQCEEGYHVQPGVTSFNITCQADGTWSNSLMCVAQTCSDQSQCENGGRCIVLPDGRPHCICPDGYTGQRCEVFLTSLIALSLIGMAAFVLSLAQCLFFGIRQCYRHTKREEVHQMTQRRMATRTNANNAVFRMPVNYQ